MLSLKTIPRRSGTLLNGRINYQQFAQGYRSGIEPILLAAAVSARKHESLLDIGCGAGASLLCLQARLPHLRSIGVEADFETALLARQNLRTNNLQRATSHVLRGYVPQLPARLRKMAPNANGRFHHVISNPPWYSPEGQPSANCKRNMALRSEAVTLDEWLRCLTRWVLPGGTITTILHSGLIDQACCIFRNNGCGTTRLMPLWPRAGQEAKLSLLQTTFGGKGAFHMLPGLILHDDEQKFTPETENILRNGAPLVF
ncbi:SAM-dependent methyltransferase [Neokomagataea tanensis]|uniref:SAM-dependent methyltransferase n=1 Tax=Neokomagataea tanensis TaxID=661191 RepID=A0A4Y6V5M5_9PROT|nr:MULTISPECIES: methyltransferase [Neokomagataea]QDH25422.1 SAM-dependent methyltransferase [Neokomagataea tanensis]